MSVAFEAEGLRRHDELSNLHQLMLGKQSNHLCQNLKTSRLAGKVSQRMRRIVRKLSGGEASLT